MIKGLFASAAILALDVAAPAFAQPGSAPTGQSGAPLNSSAPSQLPAGPTTEPGQTVPAANLGAGSGVATLGEVVVTAQRRAENLQNVPIAVEAVTPSQLANSGVSNLQDLNVLVPGVQVAISAGASNTYVRGVGSSAFGPGVESPVALYIDGVYYASEFGAPADFASVAQVEVLKGPQGTLFGRNATGGLVQITTKAPTQTPHLDADFSYGNYDESKLNFYASRGVAPALAADIAILASHQGDGYGTNMYNGKDVDKTDIELDLRSKWLYTPRDGTRVTLIFDYDQQRTSDNTLRIQPGTTTLPIVGPAYGGSPYDTDANVQPLLYHKGGGVSARLEQDLGIASLVDTVAYRNGATVVDLDVDQTATPFEGASILENEYQLTEELQLQSEKGSRVTWTGGFYYFYDDAAENPFNIAIGPIVMPPVTALNVAGTEISESAAGYAQASTEILPGTHLTVGGRYTFEKRSLDASQNAEVGASLTVPLLSNFHATKDYYRPTYRVALDHRFSPETLAYASINTGFKSGGFNISAPTDPAYQPEKLTAYAIGLKNDQFGRRLRLNLEGFYYDYTNLQIAVVENAAPGITNAASAHDYGLDVDADAQVSQALRLTAGLELLRSRIASSSNDIELSSASGALPEILGSVSGDRAPYSPSAVLNLAGDYVINVFGGQADVNATYLYNTGYYTELDNIIHQGDFSELNSSIRWKSPNDRYTVALYGKNLTDTMIIQNGISSAIGSHQTSYFAPRTYGFTIGYHF